IAWVLFIYVLLSTIPFAYVLFYKLKGSDTDGGLGAALFFLLDFDVTIAMGLISGTFAGVVETLLSLMVIGVAAWTKLLMSYLLLVSSRYLFRLKRR
ncbi:MAG: hypothetical protein VX694_12840, partial [Planctomycetota bacterium]|nr:hypothetical protein [Planctomycetota bacterium]